MVSHKQQRELAKNHLEEVDDESSISSASKSSNSDSFSTYSYPKPHSFNSLPNSIRGDINICFDNLKSSSTNSRIHLSKSPTLHFTDVQLIRTDPSCLSGVHKVSWERLKHSLGSTFTIMSSLQKKKGLTGHRREELEREVSVLHSMLHNEQKVRGYLEQLGRRKDGSALTIPSFLPEKMKVILVELAIVENEISRLESQIGHLKSEVKHEKEVNAEAKSKESVRRGPHPNNEKFEPKAMHFISKAIKGHFTTNEKPTSSREKKGTLKSPSPMREQRNPTPMPRRGRKLEANTDIIPPKALSTPSLSEDVEKWAPNKLSENIMKCLFYIFMRLLRTSRTMELDKSGPVSRLKNFSLSFRADTSLNSSQIKESRQQDPYGIFDSEDSIPRDIGPYKNLTRFTSSSMEMKHIRNSSSIHLFKRLKLLIEGLHKVDLRFLSHQQKLAFWINMYNACIMHGYLQYGVPSVFSPETLLALINKATLTIAGNKVNAQAIEHFILRKPKDKLIKDILGKDGSNSKQTIFGELYGVESPDPNITFALCLGTRSSPAAKIYTAEGVKAELEKSKLEYLQAAIVVAESRRIAVPELLLRNMKGFAVDNKEALIEWVCDQIPASCSLRKSIVDCFRGAHGAKASAVVERMPYEFEFQYLLAM